MLDGEYTASQKGLLIPRTSDGRVLFMLPWKGFTLVGTTDVPAEVVPDPRPSTDEILYLIDHLKHQLGLEISRERITAAWAGIRPLVAGDNGNTAAVPRGFKIISDPSGLYSLFGGKWTSYRQMAESFLDVFIKDLEIAGKHPCITETTILLGGEGDLEALKKRLREECGLDEEEAMYLVHSYGNQAVEVIRLSKTVENGRKLARQYPFLLGEVIYAVRHEMACTALDVLERRIRLSALDQEAALNAAPKIIELMAMELGWSLERQQEELARAKRGVKHL
jgi:glycerol-3-phosphate dehydrogenase